MLACLSLPRRNLDGSPPSFQSMRRVCKEGKVGGREGGREGKEGSQEEMWLEKEGG